MEKAAEKMEKEGISSFMISAGGNIRIIGKRPVKNKNVKELIKCKDNKQLREVGVEWAIMQSKELVSHNTPVIHFYTMGRADNIVKIAKAVF